MAGPPFAFVARGIGPGLTPYLPAGTPLAAMRDAWQGKRPERPFVILAQPSLFDRSRAPTGGHTAWAYCHVPNGFEGDLTARIEAQVERFAPGFRDVVVARSVRCFERRDACRQRLAIE